MAKGNYLKTYRYVMGKASQNLESGTRKQALRSLLPRFISAPPQVFQPLSLSGHTPPSTWACTPPPQFWLHIQSITHRLETQLAKKRAHLAQLISSASPNPIFYWEVGSLNCSPEIYGNRLYKGGHDPTRKGRAKTER